MNLSGTWTSKDLATARGRTGSDPRPTPGSGSTSQDSLRSVQKTGGLFNTGRAGNPVVASQAVKPGMDSGPMDTFVAMATDEGSLGGIFQDLPMDLTEADYLDSFMDLSNFLTPEESGKVAETTLVEDDEMKGKVLGFSGIIPSLDDVSPALTVEEPATSPRKRKPVETLDELMGTTINVSDLEFTEVPVLDHDYVSKKVKTDAEPQQSTSKVPKEHVSKSKERYRERRDKNNVASKRSREIRKNKYVEMEKEASVLEVKNEALRKKIVELENLATVMKAELIKKMTQK